MTDNLLEQALIIENALLRGDHIIGLMSPDKIHDMIRLLEQDDTPLAHIKLGDTYANGTFVSRNPEKAILHYGKAADEFPGAALHRIRLAYFFVPHEAAKYAKLDLERLLADDPEGHSHLLAGYMAYSGVGLPQDPDVALAHITTSADRGNADAMFELYVMLSTGDGIEHDEASAIDWCLKAAEAGSRRAMFNVGSFYATGNSKIEQDIKETVVWYERARAGGHGRAAAMLGVMYATADGVEFDENKANAYFDEAAELGFDVDDFLKSIGLA